MCCRFCLIFLLLVFAAGCTNKQLEPYLESYHQYQQQVFVIDHGRHTALVVKTRDLAEKIDLQETVYNRFRYIEIGRGDAGFYQDEDESISTTLMALFFSTPAVFHLRGYNNPPNIRYPQSHTLEVRLSRIALDKLMAAVASGFALNDRRAIKVGPGRNEYSGFYKAKGSYHMFYTCNNWTAEMMQQADYPISHRWAFFAGSVMRQIESVQRHLGLDCQPGTTLSCIDESESGDSR